jgi:hypothetical protein
VPLLSGTSVEAAACSLSEAASGTSSLPRDWQPEHEPRTASDLAAKLTPAPRPQPAARGPAGRRRRDWHPAGGAAVGVVLPVRPVPDRSARAPKFKFAETKEARAHRDPSMRTGEVALGCTRPGAPGSLGFSSSSKFPSRCVHRRGPRVTGTQPEWARGAYDPRRLGQTPPSVDPCKRNARNHPKSIRLVPCVRRRVGCCTTKYTSIHVQCVATRRTALQPVSCVRTAQRRARFGRFRSRPLMQRDMTAYLPTTHLPTYLPTLPTYRAPAVENL